LAKKSDNTANTHTNRLEFGEPLPGRHWSRHTRWLGIRLHRQIRPKTTRLVLGRDRQAGRTRENTMRHMLVAFLSAATLFAWAPVASAQSQIWSAAGITGIVDEADQNIHQFNTTGSVSIKSSVSSGTLDIRYPVQTLPNTLIPQQGDCPELRVNLRDTGADARVIARFMALSVFPGSGNALTTLATIDSNNGAPAGDPTQYRSFRACIGGLPPDSEFLIDYAFFAYYVDVQLIKGRAAANPGLMSVQICPAQDACDP
jgi:hypothetical protein